MEENMRNRFDRQLSTLNDELIEIDRKSVV